MLLALAIVCVMQANATGTKALARWEKNDYAGAEQLEKAAALVLEK